MKRMASPADDEHLPDEISRAVKKAVRLEWATLGVLSVTVVLVFLVMGNSQAMKTAWIEDMLSMVPPIAFLIGVRVTRKPANAKHPFGYHRAIGIAHLVAGTALFVMGGYLIVDALIKLITVEHPTIGGINLFGHTIWLGWLMILVLLVTGIPPVILGRMKLKLAEPLHNKVLYADADMNKADWMTSFAAIVGIAGIGLGLWWADAAAAIVIATSIVKDGATNLSAAVSGLMDARPTTVDNKNPTRSSAMRRNSYGTWTGCTRPPCACATRARCSRSRGSSSPHPWNSPRPSASKQPRTRYSNRTGKFATS